MENLKDQASRLQRCIAKNGKVFYYKAKTRKLEADKVKNVESDPSLLLKSEDFKEQVKFLENEKLLLKEQLGNFKSNKIQSFKNCQYSNSKCAPYQDLISYMQVSVQTRLTKLLILYKHRSLGFK